MKDDLIMPQFGNFSCCVGIVGNGSDKFTPETERVAKALIRELLSDADTIVSGHSPVGGIDIWAEEIGAELGLNLDIKTPRQNSWGGEYGYKARNLDIARSSDVVHVIVVAKLPPNYKGMVFKECYHCRKFKRPALDHVKSGACWTAIEAIKMGKEAVWHIIDEEKAN